MIFFLLACFDGKQDPTDTGEQTCLLDTGVFDTGDEDTGVEGDDSGQDTAVEPSQSNVCETDEDCTGDGQCISIVDAHNDVRVCQYPVDIWMHECQEWNWGCCSDEECDSGVCAAMEINYCGGPPPDQENVCVPEDCLVDSDCAVGSVCLPSGVLGSLTGTCIQASCMQDSDCSGDDARCSLVYDGVTCPGTHLQCTDAQSECRWYGDCEQGLCVGDEQGVSCQEELMPP